MPQFRLFCYSMPLSASGKGSGLHSLKADLLNGLVENTKIENYLSIFGRCVVVTPAPPNESKTA